MTNWLTLSLIGLGIFYCTILVILIAGFGRNRKGQSKEQPLVSVVVAARDEQAQMDALIQALLAQDYPAERLEFILVNDRSTDNTGQIIDNHSRKHTGIRALHIRTPHPGMAPKKWALNQGIGAAKGDIIMTTDADCVPPCGWIAAMVSFFEKDTGVVAGFSPLNLNASASILHRFVTLEAMALAAVAAGSIGIGMPLTCSGRNLAYRKSVFQEVGGFQRIGALTSGDDDLFLHQVRDHTSWRIRYATDPESFVPSAPAKSMRHFSHQRRRHASKGFHYHWFMVLGLMCVYLFNVMLLTALFFPSVYPVFLPVFGIKSALEFVFLFKASKQFHQAGILRFFPLAMCFHFVYVAIFGLWGQFGRFRWKTETMDKRMRPSGL